MNLPIAEVAINIPLYQTFDYRVPDNLPPLQIGSRVRVPFGRKQCIGIITALKHRSDCKTAKLKTLSALIDTAPVISDQAFALYQKLAQYYHYPLGEVLFHTLPVLLRQGHDDAFSTIDIYQIFDNDTLAVEALLKNSPKQRALYDLLQQHPQGLTLEACKAQGFSTQLLSNALNKGWLRKSHQPLSPDIQHDHQPGRALSLLPAQQQALDQINAASSTFTAFLLHGITGSGKTEVYLRAIADCLARNGQALVLIPEIALTPQTVARFRNFFAEPIVVLHSGLTDKQRLDAWLLARQGTARIIIGTRSAVFTPIPQLGIIIIDEEHDLSFKQQEGWRYCARSVALLRAQQHNIPIVMGSATPSLESFYNSQQHRFTYLSLPTRTAGAQLPEFSLIDLRQQRLQEGLSEPLLHAMRTHLQRGEQVMLFINRRGYAPVLLCHDCGWVAECSRCDARMVYHRNPDYLQCHHCGSRKALPKTCGDCASPQLVPIGTGTKRLEDFVQQQFADIDVVRIDRDSTRRKGALDELLTQISDNQAQILIGTQMLAKGHHFPNVTLVGILDVDYGFYSSDFRAAERVAQLILQVAGRAGRAQKPGNVMIQTHMPEHPLLQCLLQHDYRAFLDLTLQEREQTQLPPFSHIALLRAECQSEQGALHFLQSIKQQIGPHAQGVALLGPVPAVMQRKAGHFRAQLLLQSKQRQALHRLLDLLVRTINEMKDKQKIRWSVDVDAQEIM